jgi:hypothetical protein
MALYQLNNYMHFSVAINYEVASEVMWKERTDLIFRLHNHNVISFVNVDIVSFVVSGI